jgi:hypothetical protein
MPVTKGHLFARTVRSDDRIENCVELWNLCVNTDPDHITPERRCDKTATVWAMAMELLDELGALPWDLALLMEEICEPEVSA